MKIAKEGSEKLSKQMSKAIKSGKLDNVIASMDAGKHYIVKMRDGTVTAIEKTGLPKKIRVCLGNGCFIAGTLVTTRSGLKPIEEIKIGDYVLSRNEETGEDSYKKVADTLVRSTQEICTIELETGNIKLTTGHLFMVKNKWWKAAVELVAGDILVTSYGEDQIVKSIKVEAKGYQVITYNLTVEDNHTFFVNYEGVLTHNMNNVLKGCNFVTETSEKLTTGATEAEKVISKIDEIEVNFNYKTKYDEAEFARQLANQEAEKQAQKWLDSQAALHNPDQIAGGNPLNIGGMGDKKINSPIGSQWRYRIDEVDEQIRNLAEKMTDKEKKLIYLNVKLKY